MKRPRGGSLLLLLTPDELLAKLATLVPPPRVHGVRYHGVFAPNAKVRAQVVPQRPEPDPGAPPGCATRATRQTRSPPSPPSEPGALPAASPVTSARARRAAGRRSGRAGRVPPGRARGPGRRRGARTPPGRRSGERSGTGHRAGGEYERYLAWRHRDLAKQHELAAGQRRKEVAAVCSGASEVAPFSSMRVTSVEAIREADVPPATRHPRGYYPERLKGARIAVIPEGIAPTAAARAIECEAARGSAEMDSSSAESPLAIRTAKTMVRVADSRLAVEVRGDSGADAEEILKRAEALARSSPGNTR